MNMREELRNNFYIFKFTGSKIRCERRVIVVNIKLILIFQLNRGNGIRLRVQEYIFPQSDHHWLHHWRNCSLSHCHNQQGMNMRHRQCVLHLPSQFRISMSVCQ